MARHNNVGQMAIGAGKCSPEKQVARIANEVKKRNGLYAQSLRANGPMAEYSRAANLTKLREAVTGYIEVTSNLISSGKLKSDPNRFLNQTERSALGEHADEIFHQLKETIMSKQNTQTKTNNTNTVSFASLVGQIGTYHGTPEAYAQAEGLAGGIPAKPDVQYLMQLNEHIGELDQIITSGVYPSDINNRQAETFMYFEVMRYIKAYGQSKLPVDPFGVINHQHPSAIVAHYAKAILADLTQLDDDNDAADQVFSTVMDSIKASQVNGGQGWGDKFVMYLKHGCGVTFDFLKGTAVYVWNGVKKVFNSIMKCISFILGVAVDLVDSATTKDFGATGRPGYLRQGMAASRE